MPYESTDYWWCGFHRLTPCQEIAPGRLHRHRFRQFQSPGSRRQPNPAAGLSEHVRLIIGDVRDQDAFHQALDDQEIVVHLAAETGTGQSMYRIAHYSDVNIGGTAILLDYLVNRKTSRINKIVVASSRAVYGEGKMPVHRMVSFTLFTHRRELQSGAV